MSADHFLWFSTGSTDRPTILTLRLSNSGLSLAIVPSSVVQTGVKSFGCEKSTPQELPSQSWKRTFPSVVSASKSGAVSPIANVMTNLQVAMVTHPQRQYSVLPGCGIGPRQRASPHCRESVEQYKNSAR